jgi:hypothetical protein
MNAGATADKKEITMKLSDITHAFHQPGKPGIIDAVHPVTGLGCYSGETLEQIQARYPGAVVGEMDAIIEASDNHYRRPPVEISRERFWEMLGVLPPEGWHVFGESESFKLSEYTSGLITAIFARIGPDDHRARFFEMQDSVTLKHDEIVRRCKRLIELLKDAAEAEANGHMRQYHGRRIEKEIRE